MAASMARDICDDCVVLERVHWPLAASATDRRRGRSCRAKRMHSAALQRLHEKRRQARGLRKICLRRRRGTAVEVQSREVKRVTKAHVFRPAPRQTAACRFAGIDCKTEEAATWSSQIKDRHEYPCNVPRKYVEDNEKAAPHLLSVFKMLGKNLGCPSLTLDEKLLPPVASYSTSMRLKPSHRLVD